MCTTYLLNGYVSDKNYSRWEKNIFIKEFALIYYQVIIYKRGNAVDILYQRNLLVILSTYNLIFIKYGLVNLDIKTKRESFTIHM